MPDLSPPPIGNASTRGRTRRRRGCGRGLIVPLVLLAAAVGPSVWLDRAGVVAPARILSKREDVRIFSDGDWRRDQRLDVEFAIPRTYRSSASVSVDSARFDRLRPGDSVRVRYLPCCPIFARLADRSTLSWVSESGPALLWGLRWVAWAVGGVGAAILAARYSRVAVLLVAAAWIAATLALDRAGTPSTAPRTAAALARVHVVRRITRAFEGRRSRGFILPAPFDIATLAFVPAPALDTVVAVDAVDSGSVPGLRSGAVVAVRFAPFAPREAQLALGTRGFAARNRPLYVGVVTVVVGLTLLFALVGAQSAARRARRGS